MHVYLINWWFLRLIRRNNHQRAIIMKSGAKPTTLNTFFPRAILISLHQSFGAKKEKERKN